MKKLFLVLLAALAIVSCQKKETQPTPPATQDVTFSAIQVNPDLKSTDDIICPTDLNGDLLEPAFAKVKIAGITDPFWPKVFMLETSTPGEFQMYTQAIKLAPGNYTVEFFGLYAADQTTLIMASPGTSSPYAIYVNPTSRVNFNFDVDAFSKKEVPVEVLCYVPESYTNFGFNWFEVEQYVIRKQCFFGDLCIKDVDDYAGSLYAGQANGVQIDMPAIFEIRAYNNNQPLWPIATFSNESYKGEGAPLCVEYRDDINEVDNYKFELWIYVADGNASDGFGYVKFHEWTFADGEMIVDPYDPNNPDGSDGVVDFVLGNCNLTTTDLQLAPYMNLPNTCTLKTLSNSNTPFPGVPGLIEIQGEVGYFDVELSGIGGGFEIKDQKYAVNCVNKNETIYVPQTYTMSVHSSLYPQTMTGPCKDLRWDQVNWLINHLDQFPGYQWFNLQQALWKIENPGYGMEASLYNNQISVPAGGQIGLDMYNAATVAANDGYVPLPGGWAAVTFEGTNNNGAPTQCIFLRIDP